MFLRQWENAYAWRLRSCGSTAEGRRIHQEIIHGCSKSSSNGTSSGSGNVFLGNLLVQMYARCGSLGEARRAFDAISPRNVFSWNIMLTAYAHAGHNSSVVQLFREMILDGGTLPNGFTYATVLQSCNSIAAGTCFHSCVTESGDSFDDFVGTALLGMYSRCGSVCQARSAFEAMSSRDVVTWNAMISAFAQNGRLDCGIETYSNMNLEGISSDALTFVSVITCCCNAGDYRRGMLVEACVSSSRFNQNTEVQNALISFHAKRRSLKDSQRVFDGMQHRDVVSWTAMLSAYAQSGHTREAFRHFARMDADGVQGNLLTFTVLPSIGATASEAKLVHSCVSQSGFQSEVTVGTAIITMYAGTGNLDAAKQVFDKLPQKDVLAWNTMMAAYLDVGLAMEVLTLYRELDLDGTKANASTYINVASACSILGNLENAEVLHARITACGVSSCDRVLTTLVDMYSKLGSLDEATRCFDKLRQRNVVAWTAMVTAYAQNSRCELALRFFRLMEMEGVVPDELAFACVLEACSVLNNSVEGTAVQRQAEEAGVSASRIVGTALVCMNASYQNIEAAREAFVRIKDRDCIAYNAMICAYAHNCYHNEALQLFYEMESRGLQPTFVSLVHVFAACERTGSLEEGRKIHMRISTTGEFSSPQVVAALVTMYARCGRMDEAEQAFDMSSSEVAPWNAMVAAYAQHTGRSLELLQQMLLRGVVPDEVTFTSVLQACSYAGNAEQGRQVFLGVTVDHHWPELADEHYICMVDLFGRLGRLNEAESIARSLGDGGSIAWNSLLAACKVQGDVHRGEGAAQLDLAAAPYLMLLQLYGQDAAQVNSVV